MFDEVRMKHYGTIKEKVKRILGGRTSYYRCLRGEKLIMEEQQQRIVDLLNDLSKQLLAQRVDRSRPIIVERSSDGLRFRN